MTVQADPDRSMWTGPWSGGSQTACRCCARPAHSAASPSSTKHDRRTPRAYLRAQTHKHHAALQYMDAFLWRRVRKSFQCSAASRVVKSKQELSKQRLKVSKRMTSARLDFGGDPNTRMIMIAH